MPRTNEATDTDFKGNKMTITNHDSIFMKNIQSGVEKGYISFSDDNSKQTV